MCFQMYNAICNFIWPSNDRDRVSQSEYCMILLVELYLGESEG